MTSIQPDLIYDVGVCNGDDSAYYLHKGFRVVGIEASPLLLEPLRRRFETAISAGRYQLLAAGIAETPGEAPFWVCDERPEWSSFDRAIASRNGFCHHCVKVRTCRFGWVLETYGTPIYAKIDIEGNDNLCLDDMTPSTAPAFVSVEMIGAQGQIRQLQTLGYTAFKIVSQLTLREPNRATTRLKTLLPLWGQRLVAGGESRLSRHRADGAWRFPRGSSGPFGDDSPGEWRSADHALALSQAVSGERFDWFDIHARRPVAAEID